MFTKNQINTLAKRHAQLKLDLAEQRYMYLGILNEYQTHVKDLRQTIVYTRLNPYQHMLFKRVLHGTNVYSKEELTVMHWDKKRRIKKVWLRGQKELNAWKQILCNKASNEVFKIFEKSAIAKEILSVPVTETDEGYKNTMSLKVLGLRYEDVILFYMGKGLLPKTFLQLSGSTK